MMKKRSRKQIHEEKLQKSLIKKNKIDLLRKKHRREAKLRKNKARQAKVLTVDRVKELLSYDRDTGSFRWKDYCNRREEGAVAGNLKPNGYRRIQIDGNSYLASRLVWLIEKGSLPTGLLKRINGDRSDDCIYNLHEGVLATEKQDNIGKVKGVDYRRKEVDWISRIYVKGEAVFLGYYKTKVEAVTARWKAEVKYDIKGACSTSKAFRYLEKQDPSITYYHLHLDGVI